MLRLFCRCGYPLWVAARWTGRTIELPLFDGMREAERSQAPLQQCPQCQVNLRPDLLEGYPLPLSSLAPPPVSSPAAPASLPVEETHGSLDESEERSLVKRLLPRRGTRGAFPKQQETRRVLVVDDDQDVGEILQHWLASEGFQVASVSDGGEALAFLRREPGNWVILLDLRMPRMDGWGVLSQMQADAALTGEHKIVLMSAEWLLKEEGPPWRSPQVVAAVPKPFDLEQVLSVLTDVTSPASGEQS